jgi:type IV secretory pathway TraG/TraD family ATPase VirD4
MTGLVDGLLTGGDLWTDVLMLAAAGVVVAGAGTVVLWAAGLIVTTVTRTGGTPNPVDLVRIVSDGGDLHAVWPGVQFPVVLTVTALLLTGMFAAVVIGLGRWQAAFPPRVGYAGAGQFADLLPGRAGLAKGRRLRRSLPTRGRIAASELGVPLGRLRRRGPVLRASWEDVVLAICAPRSGKTTCLAVPAVLDAPGPVVATSNKADLWELTHAVRRGHTGQQVWTFDPQQITGTPQAFVWDALAGVRSVGDARRLAGHFIQEIRRTGTGPGGEGRDFWDRDAEDLLTALLLAAAVDRRPLGQVGEWLTAVSSVEPRNILARAGFTQLAAVMAGRSQGAVETREGVYATARAATAALSDPQIMAWVTPRPGLPVFDPAAFVRSRQTLYLLSKDGAGSAAPLVAAFADRIMLEAVRAAETSPGGRLDPPLVAVLDEAANICRITELPRLYSHLGSRGVVPITILQSRAQGRRVWGQGGMDELFSAATVKIIGAGVDEQAFAEDLSRMLGEHDVPAVTRSSGRVGGGTSRTARKERVLPADQVRALPKFTGLLLITGVRPAWIRLVPWMDGPHAEEVRAAIAGPQPPHLRTRDTR